MFWKRKNVFTSFEEACCRPFVVLGMIYFYRVYIFEKTDTKFDSALNLLCSTTNTDSSKSFVSKIILSLNYLTSHSDLSIRKDYN